MHRILLAILLTLVLWPITAGAETGDIKDNRLEESIRRVLKNNPEIIFEAFKGHEDQLYDLLQVGLEKKNKKKIKNRRLNQLKNPKVAALHPERPVWGNADGSISIIVFSDFQSATCSKADKTIRQLLKNHPEAGYRYRHNPLGLHKMSIPTALYYEAIALQSHDKAKQFNHLALENRLKIKKEGVEVLKRLAQKLGTDMIRLQKDISSEKVKKTVQMDINESKKLGFTASPVFLINGVTVTGAVPLQEFEEVIQMIKSEGR